MATWPNDRSKVVRWAKRPIRTATGPTSSQRRRVHHGSPNLAIVTGAVRIASFRGGKCIGPKWADHSPADFHKRTKLGIYHMARRMFIPLVLLALFSALLTPLTASAQQDDDVSAPPTVPAGDEVVRSTTGSYIVVMEADPLIVTEGRTI